MDDPASTATSRGQPIKWVVFDLGDVVLTRTVAMAPLAHLLATDPELFTGSYWAHRPAYDMSSDAPAFWTSVAASSGSAAPDSALIEELVRVDDLGWNVPDPEVLTLIQDLTDGGAGLAVLSNAPASMGRLIEAAPWAAQFQHLMFSGDLGLIKPDGRIFSHLVTQLAATPAEVAFLDDRPDNVAGAQAAGLVGLLFTGPAQARTDLRGLGLPV